MKKIAFLLSLCIYLNKTTAQITYDNTYSGNYYLSLVKLQISGYKYIKSNLANSNVIELYNINHSLFKTMTIPPVFGVVQSLSYVSETLFDTDNLVEYAVNTYSGSGINKSRVYIFKENGTLLLMRDSAWIADVNGGIFNNYSGVYFDGINTKMNLVVSGAGATSGTIMKNEIYTLPGTIPCSECSSGTITGMPTSPSGTGNGGNAVFYPNPVTDQLKLKYELPKGYKTAEINIYDLQGKLIENFKVSDAFDFIYVPSDYNNGTYLYTLVADGKAIKTEKVILNK